ncbi:MAG: DnaD domain protein [Bacilli bacterium]|nr:DnaD domain protein [Bacilli bacterium]
MAKSLFDTFKIKGYKSNSEDYVIYKREIEYSDIFALTYLYLPLLGIDSYSVYISLSTFDIDKSYSFKKAIDILGLKSLKDFNNAIYKLEGIGLLREYNKDDEYVFVINKPLHLKEFLKEECLRNLLVSEIGEDEVKKLIDRANNENNVKVGYKEVTKKFEDIFDIQIESSEEEVWNDLYVKDKDEILIANSNFNYALFELLIDSSFVDKGIVESDEFKNNIKRIAFTFKLNEEQMKDCVFSALDIDKSLQYPALAKNAKRIFRESYKHDNPILVAKENDQFMTSASDDKEVVLATSLEAMSFADNLQRLSNMQPSTSEIDMFTQLLAKSNLTVGAINWMIMLTNKEKGGTLPQISYFEKIANTWARAGVKNAYDAIKYTLKESERRKTEMSKPKHAAIIPEWYDKYREEVDKSEGQAQNTEVTQEMLDAVKALFGDEDE